MTTHQRCTVATIILAILFLSAAATAQDSAAGDSLEKQWDDFVHYVTIARPDLAASFGQAILDSAADPADVYAVAVATENVELLLGRGEKMSAGLGDVVRSLRTVIDDGYQKMRADPVGIADAIARLTGSSGQAILNARDRLLESREYAVPQLLLALMEEGAKPQLRTEIINFLPKLGKDGVRPLTIALQTDDPELLEILARALGEIGYPHAVPRLREAMDTHDLLPRTQAVFKDAIVKCGGQAALEKPLAELYYEQSLGYYNREDSLQADARFDQANVWYFKPIIGVEFIQVPREIFCDIYAMRTSRLALKHDANFYPAVSLWLAANIRKEADLPEGDSDPTRGDDQPSAAYYIRAAGAKYAQEVLRRALDDFDSRVAIPAIEALVDTAGTENLLRTTTGGAQPLVEAMTYPDRHVRYAAALSLANAMPKNTFEGHDLVLTVLNEALRQTGQRTILLIVDDPDRRNLLKDVAREAKFAVIDEPDPAKAIVAGYEAGGVDIVFIASSPPPSSVVAMLRSEDAFAAVPIVIAAMNNDTLRSLAKADGRTVIMGEEVTKETFRNGLKAARPLTTGEPMNRRQRNSWAIRTAQSVRRLGLAGCATFDIERARPTLINLLTVEVSEVQTAAAEGLAALGSTEAQQAIVSLAGDKFAENDVRISALAAVAESVRLHGNHLLSSHAEIILGIVNGKGPQDLRQAAAQALGAMDLPSDQIKSLILITDGHD